MSIDLCPVKNDIWHFDVKVFVLNTMMIRMTYVLGRFVMGQLTNLAWEQQRNTDKSLFKKSLKIEYLRQMIKSIIIKLLHLI